MFDPSAVETIHGEVVAVDRFVQARGPSKGVHITLNTKKGEVSVDLGPDWLLKKLDMIVLPKDRLQVKGSRVTFGGRPVIIATEIQKGSKTVKLRDEKGTPLWSGWRRTG